MQVQLAQKDLLLHSAISEIQTMRVCPDSLGIEKQLARGFQAPGHYNVRHIRLHAQMRSFYHNERSTF